MTDTASAGVTEVDVAEANVSQQADQKKRHGRFSFCAKVLCTTATFFAVFSMGMGDSSIAASLLDLQLMTHTSTSEISLVFTVRGVMALLSSIFMGPIFDKIDGYFVCGIMMLISFFLYGAAPWSTNLPSILATLGLPEFNGFGIFIGSNLICLRIWGEKAGPILHILNFFALAGFMVGPLIVQPFLSDENEDDVDIKIGTDKMTQSPQLLTGPVSENISFQPEWSTPIQSSIDYTDSHSALRVSSLTTMTLENISVASEDFTTRVGLFSSTDESRRDDETYVKYALWIVAGSCLLTAIFMLAIFLCGGHKLRRDQDKSNSKGTKCPKRENSKGFVVSVSILVFLLNVFYAGIEVGYSGLLMAFAVDDQGWSKTEGTWLLTTLQAANCCILGISIVLAKFIKPNVLLGFNVFILSVSLLAETFFVESHDIVLWVCTVGVGIGYGTIMPCTLTWLDGIIGIYGKFSSVYWTGYAVGYSASPAVTAVLMKEFGKMWFMYVNVISAIVVAITYVLMSIVIQKHWHTREPEVFEPEVIETKL